MHPGITDGTTFISPLALGITLLMGVLLVILPRRYALIPVMVLVCYMTMGQRILVVGLDFTMIRILVLFGWARILIRGEFRGLQRNPLDNMLLLWVVASLVMHTLQQGSSGFIYKAGHAYNAVGLYFLFRCLVRNVEEAGLVLRQLAALVVPLAAVMLWENATGRNLFSVFGAVPEFTRIRDGVLRCQGPFAHPILAGTFGATTLPLFIALWWQRGGKLLALAGSISAAVICITAASSGPVFAMAAGAGAFALWRWRAHLWLMRRTLVITLIALHLVMKAPVWFLIGRVSAFGGSTGWHRAFLIDRWIANFWDWWLIGTSNPGNWGPRLSDVTNQYIVEAVHGGVLPFVLFVWLMVRAFRAAGLGRQHLERQCEPRWQQFALWGMGAALLSHAVNFISVSYFDQNYVNWMLLLALISSSGGALLATAKAGARSALRPAPAGHLATASADASSGRG